ncbi:MAG: hypothetical protein KF889_17905 [Alphaproteobacteria bacterium]|nr:hypothetical protein [Alphaproteobacteria bacterium]MCW5741329.1 hypothetical protein [Alphaproteobacteria bacterium]
MLGAVEGAVEAAEEPAQSRADVMDIVHRKRNSIHRRMCGEHSGIRRIRMRFSE